MKRFVNSLGITLVVALAMLFTKPADAQPRVGVNISFQTFYDELSPYGDWIDYPDYGYTWRPRVGNDFRPYSSNGYWMYTNDYDWMWNSGYDWGWAPFHYGRWFYDPYYGWMWVPGYDWSPGWVAWRGGGDYYGWAPLRPGFNINIGFGNYNCPYDYWTFAPGRYMNSRFIGNYYYPYRNNVTIINRTTIINNYGGGRGGRGSGYYTNGPRRSDVERYTGSIRGVNVRDSRRPGRASVGRGDVSVYRPSVERGSGRSTYSPRTVQSYDRNRADAGIARNSGRSRDRVNDMNGLGNTRSDRTDSRSMDRNNVSPRRQDAINSRGRENNTVGSEARGTQSDRGDDQAISEMRQRRNNIGREDQMNSQRSNDVFRNRSTEMRQRREEVQQQRNQEMQMQRSREDNNRATEMQQRREQMQQQRNQEMQMQRSREDNNRAAEMQQRREQMQQQRDQQMRQRQADVPQRSYEAPARQPRVERQSSPSFEGRGAAPSRGFESRSVDRGSVGGGERGGGRRGR